MTIGKSNNSPVHPGVILKKELERLGLSCTRFALRLQVSPNVITIIVAGKRSISTKMSIRLGRAFGVSYQHWLSLQNEYDLALAKIKYKKEIDKLIPLDSEQKGLLDVK